MKKYLILLLAVTLSLCISSVAFANLQASPVFVSSAVVLTTSKNGEFSASTKQSCSSIKVTSVVLEKKTGGSWSADKTLSSPSSVGKNTSNYSASIDYSSNVGTGTYRLKAVFNADGMTVTCYSSERTF